MREMTEAERERITAEIAADPDQLADLMADRMPLALRRWMLDRAVAGADATCRTRKAATKLSSACKQRSYTLLHPSIWTQRLTCSAMT